MADLSAIIAARSISLTPVRWSFVTASLTAQPFQSLAVDTTAGSITVTMPVQPNDGDSFQVADISGSASNYAILFTSPVLLKALPSTVTLKTSVAPFTASANTAYTSLIFVYSVKAAAWYILTNYSAAATGTTTPATTSTPSTGAQSVLDYSNSLNSGYAALLF